MHVCERDWKTLSVPQSLLSGKLSSHWAEIIPTMRVSFIPPPLAGDSTGANSWGKITVASAGTLRYVMLTWLWEKKQGLLRLINTQALKVIGDNLRMRMKQKFISLYSIWISAPWTRQKGILFKWLSASVISVKNPHLATTDSQWITKEARKGEDLQGLSHISQQKLLWCQFQKLTVRQIGSRERLNRIPIILPN